MPISIDQFNASSRPTADRIREFLAKHKDQAFTALEIVAALENLDEIMAGIAISQNQGDPNGLAQRYGDGLATLEANGELRGADLGGTRYFALK